MAAGMLAATSCSEYSDYNETPADQTPASGQTLWENISQNSQLSDFAALVRQSGFDAQLNTPRSLTVWAPANGTFDPSQFQGMSQEDLLKKFVKGHIAEYSHAATGKVEERVHMLNQKSFNFLGDGSYTFDGLGISQANMPNSNGLLHVLNGAAPFLPNLYEFISTADGMDIDSLKNHFMRYEETSLDENASVKGPMVDGVQTYIDSVMVTTNTLVNQLNARLSNEDSTYTFILPTNKAFMDMYNKVKSCYSFIETTTVQDVAAYTTATSTNTKTVTVNPSYLSDSLARRIITRNLIYSNNDGYNKWILGNGEFTDTIRSTTRGKFSNPKELLEERLVAEPVEMSNGWGRIVDSLAFYPWETYCPELTYTTQGNMAKLFPAASQVSSTRVVNADGSALTWLFGPETTLTEFRYGRVLAGGDRTKPDFYMSLPNVQSATYNFYVVLMPVGPLYDEHRPNWLNFQLYYCGANGKTATYNFSKAYAEALKTGGTLPSVPSSVSSTTAFTNNPEITDTLFIGRFTFPVNYNGLGQDYSPYLRVTSPISTLNNTQLATYLRDVHIAAVLLTPVELDEYRNKNKKQ